MYVVIAGGGKVGSYLASILLRSGHEVAIIERDLKTADQLSVSLQGRYLIIHGDGCDSRYQEDAGIRRADVFVASTGQDDNNLVACEIAKLVFNCERVIARVNNPKNTRIFRKVGIEPVSSTRYIASLIEEEALRYSYSATHTLADGSVALVEEKVPHMRHHSNEEGINIDSIELPESAMIVAVATPDDVIVATEDLAVFPGDRVIIIGNSDILDEARKAIRSL